MKYKRILLKLSGESLLGSKQYGIDAVRVEEYAEEILAVVQQKVQVAVVIGGGNIFRGLQGTDGGVDRVRGDYMGMLATVINSLALQSALEKLGISTILLSGLPVDPLCERMESQKALAWLEKYTVVIISGGTGNPYFTTDTAAALRAVEIKADIVLKGTRVDGVYTADPEKDKTAEKYEKLTFDEAYSKGLQIMDLTAFTLCRENGMPIIVFDMNKKGNLKKVCMEGNTGTLIY